jgi:O-antigen biosynthesis protein
MQKVHALHNLKDGFLVKGRADNAHAVMSAARVCLASLRFGAGIKGKLLALRHAHRYDGHRGRRHAQGPALEWQDRQHGKRICRRVSRAYNNEGERQNAQQNGLVLLKEVFSKQSHGPRFIETLAQTQNGLKAIA